MAPRSTTLAATQIKPPKYIQADKLEGKAFYMIGARNAELLDKGVTKAVVNFHVAYAGEEWVMTLGSSEYRRSFVDHFLNKGDAIGPITMKSEKTRDNSKFKTWMFDDVSTTPTTPTT